MRTQQVDITDEQAAFIQRSIAAGHFDDAGDVIRTALTALAHDEADEARKLAELRRIAAEAFAKLDRGEGIPIPSDEIGTFAQNRLKAMLAASTRASTT